MINYVGPQSDEELDSDCDSWNGRMDDEVHVSKLPKKKQEHIGRKRLRRDAHELFGQCDTKFILDNHDNNLVEAIVGDLKTFETKHDNCHHGDGKCADTLFKHAFWTEENLRQVIYLMRGHGETKSNK